MYSGDADSQEDETDAALAAFGLKLEREVVVQESADIECWPDNWQALQLFAALRTQWNMVQGGVIGLRYEAIPVVLTEFGIKKKARAGLLQSLRVMEDEALQVFREANG